MITLNLSEAKARLSSVVDAAQKGETLFICKRNVPVAQVTAVPREESGRRHRTKIGWAKGSGVRILGDIIEPAMPESGWDMLR